MDPEAQKKFDLELCWCLDRLKSDLSLRNLSDKQGKDILKAIKILESPKAPLPKKRQAMRNSLGDYRKKMEMEERNLKLDAKVSQLTKPSDSSRFVKKSRARFGEKSSEDFKFNFSEDSEALTVTAGVSAESRQNEESSSK